MHLFTLQQHTAMVRWWLLPPTVSVAATWDTARCFGSLTAAQRWSFAAAHVALLSRSGRLTAATISANVSTAWPIVVCSVGKWMQVFHCTSLWMWANDFVFSWCSSQSETALCHSLISSSLSREPLPVLHWSMCGQEQTLWRPGRLPRWEWRGLLLYVVLHHIMNS